MIFVFTLLLKLTKDVGKAALVLVVVTPAKKAFVHDMYHPKCFWLRQEHLESTFKAPREYLKFNQRKRDQ